MDVKSSVEEKRVKSTIIRRRAKVEPEIPVVPAPIKKEEEVLASPQETLEVVKKAPAVEETSREETPKVSIKTPARRKTKDELEMEVIDRVGGLKRAVGLMEVAPERLERVFRPDRNSNKKRRHLIKKDFKKTEITTPKAIKRVIRIEKMVTVGDLAHRMGVKTTEVLKKLMDLGVMATIQQTIDIDTAILVAHDFAYEVENVTFEEASVFEKEGTQEEEGDRIHRSPIVTVMGHVDHGKTSLLDMIRKTNVVGGEAGGITQHIGAYDVKVTSKDRMITFIDTPGHEAFTSMRARGAQVTDIVVLVVAADDGVMPQTIEAINHAKAAKVPILVAINKIDKPEADPARVERGLMEHGLISEKLGGDTIFIPLSAKTGVGINELLEMILLQTDVQELKANPKRRAIGTIIEARLDRGRGPVATAVIQDGTLRVGDLVVAGTSSGKIRALLDAKGDNIQEAGPSKRVEILGLSSVPLAGDKIHTVESEEDLRKISEHREQLERETRHGAGAAVKLEDLYAKAAHEQLPEVRVIVKGDVQGSIEALREAVTKLSGEKIRISVLHTGVGVVTESDVMLAVASKAMIVAFNVRPDNKSRQLAEHEKVQIRTYSIIYNVIDDMKLAMEGLLKPTYQEQYLGRVEVRQLFTVSKVGTVAGGFVQGGKIIRSAGVRLLRDGKVVYEGKLASLKRFKDEAREVLEGLECGFSLEKYNDLKVGDLVEAYTVQEIAGKL